MRIPTVHVVMAAAEWHVRWSPSLWPPRGQRRRNRERPLHRPMSDRFSKRTTTCMACHNGLTTPTGEDVSIGHAVARVDDGARRS